MTRRLKAPTTIPAGRAVKIPPALMLSPRLGLRCDLGAVPTRAPSSATRRVLASARRGLEAAFVGSCRSFVVRLDLAAKVTQDPRQQSRHLHLRDADVGCYLLLGPTAEEPQLDDAPVTRTKPTNQRSQNDPRLRRLPRGIIDTDHLAQARGVAGVGDGSVERRRGETTDGGQGFVGLLPRLLQVLRELRGPW